jgi:hypothetical protein
MKRNRVYLSADNLEHTLRIKTVWESQISSSFGKYEPYDKIILVYIPSDDILSDGKVRGYNKAHRQYETYDIFTLTLDLIEHETIHKIIHEIENLKTSAMLDCTNLETIREEEYFPEYAQTKKSEGKKTKRC